MAVLGLMPVSVYVRFGTSVFVVVSMATTVLLRPATHCEL